MVIITRHLLLGGNNGMQHLILPPIVHVKQNIKPNLWQNRYAIYKIMIQTNQIDRADKIFKEFKGMGRDQLSIDMYEEIMYGWVRKYEETVQLRDLERVEFYFKDILRVQHLERSAKSYALMCRAYLTDLNPNSLTSLNRLMEEPKSDFFKNKKMNAQIALINKGSMHKKPYLLDEIIKDTVLVNAPKKTYESFCNYLKLHQIGDKSINPDSKFIAEAKAMYKNDEMKNSKSVLIPEEKLTIMPTFGVHLLKEAFSNFDQLVADKRKDYNELSAYDLFHLQSKLEEQSYKMSFEMIEKKTDVLDSLHGTQNYSVSSNFQMNASLKSNIYRWCDELQLFFQDYIKKIDTSSVQEYVFNSMGKRYLPKVPKEIDDKENNHILPLLIHFDPKDLAMITIMQTVKSLTSTSAADLDMEQQCGLFNSVEEINTSNSVFAKSSSLSYSIGLEIMKQYNVEVLQSYRDRTKGSVDLDKKLMSMASNTARIDYKMKSLINLLHTKFGAPLHKDPTLLMNEADHKESFLLLNPEITMKLGAFALKALIDSCKITLPDGQISNAFYNSYLMYKVKKSSIIRVHHYVNSIIMNSNVIKPVEIETLPMIVEPKPWTSWSNGGYLTAQSAIVRVAPNCKEQINYVKESSYSNRLDKVFEALNVLGKTPWVINQPVLDVAIKIWNSGLDTADFPKLYGDTPKDLSPLETFQFNKMKRENFSLRCSLNYSLEVAARFRNFTLYFPHSIDFRGRAYPIPSYLNHISSDLSRGLLKFKRSKPLGEAGWKWLKIHLANVCGYDKASFEDRSSFADQHMKEISLSATDPLGKGDWWLKSDDKWQTLATCIEIHNAIQSGNPLTFESNMPVHQDGSCNGLQHYAAIGKDAKGASLVNLTPQKKPADVYTLCANNVLKLVLQDLEDKNSRTRNLAEFMKDKINRKLVKQTVMTIVYGVTNSGARAQVEARLKEANYTGYTGKITTFTLSNYVVQLLFKSIGELFKGAVCMQKWFKDISTIVCRSVHVDSVACLTDEQKSDFKDAVENSHMDRIVYSIKKEKKQSKALQELYSSMIWTAPNGLVCVQPYRKEPKKALKTALNSFAIDDRSSLNSVSVRKQSSAFPPNYIHSVDASHMMLTAIECDRANLTFASVHDSFWSLAADIEQMNGILRTSFIKMHSVDLALKLRQEIVERYKNHIVFKKGLMTNIVIPEVPERGDFEVSSVKESEYFFH